jgi:hypothetical protein
VKLLGWWVVAFGLASACDDDSQLSMGSDAASVVVVDAFDAGAVKSVEIYPFVLVPTFSPTISDYSVRCAPGSNYVNVTVAYIDGKTQTTAVALEEGQELEVANAYWVRCLPNDFPAITVSSPGTPTPGYYLLNSTTYAIVFDTNGTPVWYAHGGSQMIDIDSPTTNTISLMPDAVQGAPFGILTTQHYEVRSLATSMTLDVYASTAPTDFHELQTLPNGDHLILTYILEPNTDLTGLQSYGPGETMADCAVQEVDSANNLVWSWLASDHVDPIQESLAPAVEMANTTSVVDVFHCNSIDFDGSGNLLVSMRHTCAVFYIDHATGTVLWKLGGSSYNKDGATLIQVQNDPETTFSLQHDARFQPNGDISLFDDHGIGPGVARGVEYAIDHAANTATPVFQYLGTVPSQYEGSFRRFADGDSVIGWGYAGNGANVLTEIDSSGNDLFDIAFAGDTPSYRAIKVPPSQLDITVLRATAGQ